MTPELLNKLKHLANIAAHLPSDVTLEDEDAAMKALHGELAADTVLQMIALAESALSAQDEVLTDEQISAIYEQSQGMTLRDRDFQGVAAFARAIVKAFPAPANPHTEIREAILQYYDDLSARKHGGVAQDKAFQAIQDALGMSWSSGVDHRTKYVTPSPSLAVRDVVEERNSALEEAAQLCNKHAQKQSSFHQYAEMYVADYLARAIRELKGQP